MCSVNHEMYIKKRKRDDLEWRKNKDKHHSFVIPIEIFLYMF